VHYWPTIIKTINSDVKSSAAAVKYWITGEKQDEILIRQLQLIYFIYRISMLRQKPYHHIIVSIRLNDQTTERYSKIYHTPNDSLKDSSRKLQQSTRIKTIETVCYGNFLTFERGLD